MMKLFAAGILGFTFYFCFFIIHSAFAKEVDVRMVGVAKIDVTPDFPIRLNGYYGRNTEATNAAQRIFAKALAIGGDHEKPAVLVTLDNCILPIAVHDAVVDFLQKKTRLDAAHVAICVSHTHTAPFLKDSAPNLYGMDIPPADQDHIDRYTLELIEKLERVALAALKDRRPSKLAWGQTRAMFAANRRTKGGPVDDSLPFLTVTDPQGHLRAILGNYACHCTTLGGNFTQICGDWAGYAQEYLEADHPGIIAMTAIGCAADANPFPRGDLPLAKAHGREFADAVDNAMDFTLTPLNGPLHCALKKIEISLTQPPVRAEWEQLAKTNNAAGYHARKNLTRLDRGEPLETEIPYFVQTWSFGDDLAMIFLSGEVVVDYSLRLKAEFHASRLWINAYANYVPCYIPSKRILKEGGYEGGGAMVYYDHPAKFTPEVEDKIVATVHELMPKEFLFDAKRAQFPPPKSPQESLEMMRTKTGLKIELAVSEPLIESPVYIDFGPDGKMWVVEMRDYPMGMDGHWKAGGRIKYLESTHHDGHYDKATLFLDNLPFPTGVMPWRDGALVCTAPDILFARSTTNGGYANEVKKIFSGFFTDNYQARVNGLSFGLDNWVYGANGLLGGIIHGMANGQEFDIRGRDFRMHPDTAIFEPAAGLTQQGRVRDDWGNWFGCDNSNPLWYYPLPDHYVKRNPYLTAPSPRIYAATGVDPNLVHPISPLLERFNDPNSANHVTSGCGLGIYRDTVLGEQYYNNSFTCEPVGNLVYRLQLHENENGSVISGTRPADEQASEFLASPDNWFRPVQICTGPDGALYVVDMYRFVIEHPRWIGKERLVQLDVRAGADRGRIYRIVPVDKKLRAIPNLKELSIIKLVSALNTQNGPQRDLIQIELVQRKDSKTVEPLLKLSKTSQLPQVRLQALCILDGMQALPKSAVIAALGDQDAHVRRQAIRLSENFSANVPPAELLDLTNDSGVSLQLALSLGQRTNKDAGAALGTLAEKNLNDPWVRAAVLSSAIPETAEILKAVMSAPQSAAGRDATADGLITTVVGKGNPADLANIFAFLLPEPGTTAADWRLSMFKSLLAGLDRKKESVAAAIGGQSGQNTALLEKIKSLFAQARKIAVDASAKESSRRVAIQLLGHEAENETGDLQTLGGLLKPANPLPIQEAALDTLKYNQNPQVPGLLLANWKGLSPALRAPILEILLSRQEFTGALLDAVEKRTIQTAEISAANRQRLLKNSSQAIQVRAAKVLEIGAVASRADVMTKYQSVIKMSGDSQKGSLIFSKNCVPCHRLKGQGSAVGPNLAPLVDKTPGDFLLAILDPNAAVEPRFIAYNIETKDDRSLTGIVSAESSTSLTLVQPGGIQEKILRTDILDIRATGLSLMPEGFEQSMSGQDLADLIAYLKEPAAKKVR